MKKNLLLVVMLLIAAMTANAQPQGMRRGMMPRSMMVDYRNPDSLATVMAKEMNFDEGMTSKFIPLYAAYLNEFKKLDEMLPINFRFERGQRPSEEEINQMREIMEAREQVTNEMQKIYDQKFTDLLGKEAYAHLQELEKKQAEKRMQEMRRNFGRRFQGGGRPGGGFPGGGFPGGGFPDAETQGDGM